MVDSVQTDIENMLQRLLQIASSNENGELPCNKAAVLTA
jgi:hypothetical protein